MFFKRLIFSCLFVLGIVFEFSVVGQACEDGTILFREDFGGNNVSDPAVGPALPSDVISLPFSNNTWAGLKNGYDIRKEAIRRSDRNPHDHIYAGWYADFGDHTYEDDMTRGYFLVVDLDDKNATFYKTKVDNLCENTNLTFSFWGRSLNASSSAPVMITLEDEYGALIGQKTFTLDCKVYAWRRFDMPFLVPEGQSSVIYKVYSGAGYNGGDIALDDIEIRLCKTPVQVNAPDTLCYGEKYELKASYDNMDNSYVEPITYTWFKNSSKNYLSEDGWTKVATGPTLSFPNLSDADKGFYKVFVSSAGIEGTFDKCNSSSDIVEIALKKCECLPVDTLIKDTICENEFYMFGGERLTEEGEYTDNLINAEGCDSVVVLKLTVLPNVKTSIKDTICLGDSYSFDGRSLTTAGDYEAKLMTTAGCDSIVSLKLTVLEPVETSLEKTICEGQSYTFGSQLLTTSGEYKEHFLTSAGCDSLVTLKLTVSSQSIGILNESICEGESYTFDGRVLTEEGLYEEKNLISVSGCDSVTYLNLTVLKSVKTNLMETICNGESYTFGSRTLTASGEYEDHFVSASGCDSLVTLKLTVLAPIGTYLEETVCSGESYTFGGRTLTTTGEYEDHFVSASGCDSLVTLKLTVSTPIVNYLSASVCGDETYLFGGQALSVAGNYEEHFTSAMGCDSTVYLTLVVLEKSYTTLKDTISMTRIYRKNGFDISDAKVGENVYDNTLTNAFGCDSIVTLNLFVQARGYDTTRMTICEGEKVMWREMDCSEDGFYESVVKMADPEMDSLYVLEVKHYPKMEIEDRYELKMCYGMQSVFSENCLVGYNYQWTPSDHLSSDKVCNPSIKASVDSFQYKVYVSNAHCRDSFLVDVYASEAPTIMKTDYDTDMNEYTVVADGGTPEYSYAWEDGLWQSTPNYPKEYSPMPTLVRVMDSHGCVAESYATIFLSIIPAEYMSPNGDGIRDTWEIENLTYYSKYIVRIFDRFGKLLVEYNNEYPGWDGTYMGFLEPSTDYWYVITVSEIDREYAGHFTIIRAAE